MYYGRIKENDVKNGFELSGFMGGIWEFIGWDAGEGLLAGVLLDVWWEVVVGFCTNINYSRIVIFNGKNKWHCGMRVFHIFQRSRALYRNGVEGPLKNDRH